MAVLDVDRLAAREGEATCRATLNSTSRAATRWISIRDRMSFHRASCRKASIGNVAVELAVDAGEQVERELRRSRPPDRHRRRSADRSASPGPSRSAAASRGRAAHGTAAAGRSRSTARNCRWSSRGRSRAWAVLDARAEARTGGRNPRRPGSPRSAGSAAEARAALCSR